MDNIDPPILPGLPQRGPDKAIFSALGWPRVGDRPFAIAGHYARGPLLGETPLGTKSWRLFYCTCSVAGVALTFLPAVPARADFFDDARKTFTSDIPHFFQDDIPCFFGGQPTSGTRKSCKSLDQPAKPTAKGVGASSNTAGSAGGSSHPSNAAP